VVLTYGRKKEIIFSYAGPSHFLKCYEKIICGKFGYDDLPPSRAARGMKNDQRG